MPSQSHRRKSSARYVTVGEAPGKAPRAEWLRDAYSARLPVLPPNMAIIYICQPVAYPAWSVTNSLPWEGLSPAEQPSRVVCIWDCVPVDAMALVSWKDAFLGNQNSDHSILVCPATISDLDAFRLWFEEQVQRWHSREVPDEPIRFQIGEHVQIPRDALHSQVSAAFVSMSFGVMEQMLERLEFWRRRFFEQVGHVGGNERRVFQERLAPILRKSETSDAEDWARRENQEQALHSWMQESGLLNIHPAALPVVLLTGETGSGKTLIARYLARSANGLSLPFARVSMPEFESSEHMFEYEVFGYRGGSYSDAPPGGDAGILLNHLGGVVFLDEIGDASRQTQRKLLAYLDDYEVRPRGVHRSIFCPTMVVAATNHDLERDIADGAFRRDLYERFDQRVRVPSLNERKPDFDFILDTVMQNPGINPGHRIRSLSDSAYAFLTDLDYSQGNFRRLENLLRFGIREALRGGRTNLIGVDLSQWQPPSL